MPDPRRSGAHTGGGNRFRQIDADLDLDLALALRLADAADAITTARFRADDLRVETKPDLTPVTESDREVEETLRERIGAERPGDAVLGEEYGATGGGDRRWLLDPIDATKNFVRGVPVWATLIALERSGSVDVGVVSAPALGRRWWAARGGGAFANGDRIAVSDVRVLADAHVGYDDIPAFEDHGMGEQFLDLARRCWRTRGFGDFWQHVLVAEGALDAALEPSVAPWDIAALIVILEEAGGCLTDLSGSARIDGGSVVTSNGLVLDAVLEAVGR